MPDGRDSREYLAHLHALENQAKGREARRAGYGTAVKYLELIGNKLCKAGWSLGWVSAIDSQGRTIWIVDAHRGYGKRFIVRADES